MSNNITRPTVEDRATSLAGLRARAPDQEHYDFLLNEIKGAYAKISADRPAGIGRGTFIMGLLIMYGMNPLEADAVASEIGLPDWSDEVLSDEVLSEFS